MNALRTFFFLALLSIGSAEEIAVKVLASVDLDRAAALGLKAEVKRDMPDFTITHLFNPDAKEAISIFEGAHPNPFSARGGRKMIGEVKGVLAGKSIVWSCWSEQVEGSTRYGAEALLPSRLTTVTLPDGKKEEFVEQFHVFMVRNDQGALAEARKLAATLIKL